MKKKKFWVWVVCSFLVFSMIGLAWAQQQTVTTSDYDVDGKFVIFKNAEGETIESKMSSSRTEITVKGQSKGRDDMKAGLGKMTIIYEEDGEDNEAKKITIE